jgi:hypothetical protein
MGARSGLALAAFAAVTAAVVTLGGPADVSPQPDDERRTDAPPPHALRLAAGNRRPASRGDSVSNAPRAPAGTSAAGASAPEERATVTLRVSGWDAAGGAVVAGGWGAHQRQVVCPEPHGEGRIALDAVPPGAWIATVHVGDPSGAGWALGSAVIDVEAGRPAAASLTVGAPVFALDPDSRRP